MDADAKQIPYYDAERPQCCPDLTHVTAAYRPVTDQIAARCEHDTFVKFLSKEKYGHEFGLGSSRDTSRQPNWYRINERRRFEILERDGFACVWCREPASEERVEEVRSIAVLRSRDVGDGTEIVEWGIDEVSSEKTFFGHDADHLFTLSDIELLRSHVKQTAIDCMAKEWIVASCARCNRGRRDNPTPMRSMLSVYARHLFERSGKPDWEELTLFAATARMLAFRRAARATGTGG